VKVVAISGKHALERQKEKLALDAQGRKKKKAMREISFGKKGEINLKGETTGRCGQGKR